MHDAEKHNAECQEMGTEEHTPIDFIYVEFKKNDNRKILKKNT